MADTLPLKGSCLCAAVRYELAEAPKWAHACHCSRCRKVGGAPFAADAFVPLESFAYVAGEEHLGFYQPPAAERFVHTFCTVCGATLPSRQVEGGIVVVPLGSLDDDPGLGPKAHIWVDSKAPWDVITDDLPQHPERLGS